MSEQKEKSAAIKFYGLAKIQIDDLPGTIHGYKVEGFQDGYKQAKSQIETLEKENAELREAIEQILEVADDFSGRSIAEQVLKK